jgi:hypothetical protein
MILDAQLIASHESSECTVGDGTVGKSFLSILIEKHTQCNLKAKFRQIDQSVK